MAGGLSCQRIGLNEQAAMSWTREDNCLYLAIYHGMRYYFARIMCGASAAQANAWSRGVTMAYYVQSNRQCNRMWMRHRRHALRAQGLSYYATRAVLEGTTVAQARQRHLATHRRYGLQHGRESSPRWIEDQVQRLARKLGME